MEPNYQSPQQPPTPGPGLEYLDSIAAQPRIKTINPFVLWGAIVAALVIVVIVVINIAGGGTSTKSVLAQVGATSSALKELSDEANGHIQSSDLRTINSNLSLTLANTNRDLSEPLATQKISLKDPKKNKTVAEVMIEYEQVAERLEDARLNGLYDRTYAREVTYQLKNLHSYMSQLYGSTRSTSLKSALETNDDNLAPLLEEFESFNAS
jgi:hypothetical protein